METSINHNSSKTLNRHPILDLLRIAGGVLLILAGIVGLLMPFLQGVVLIVGGLYMISPEHGKRFTGAVRNFFNRAVARK